MLSHSGAGKLLFLNKEAWNEGSLDQTVFLYFIVLHVE